MEPLTFTAVLPNQQPKRYRRFAVAVSAAVAAVALLCLLAYQRPAVREQTTDPSAYPDDVWVYAGHSAISSKGYADIRGVDTITRLIRRDHFETEIHLIKRLSVGPLRAAFWNPHCEVLVFPPVRSYPTLGKIPTADLKMWVAKGGNLVFVGSYLLEMFVNDLFGWEIEGTYGPGPYFLNPRAAQNSPFQYLSSTLEEVSMQPLVGVTLRSIPQPGGHCIYDSNGICVAFYISHHLGTVTYIADAFSQLNTYDAPRAGKWVDLFHAAMMV